MNKWNAAARAAKATPWKTAKKAAVAAQTHDGVVDAKAASDCYNYEWNKDDRSGWVGYRSEWKKDGWVVWDSSPACDMRAEACSSYDDSSPDHVATMSIRLLKTPAPATDNLGKSPAVRDDISVASTSPSLFGSKTGRKNNPTKQQERTCRSCSNTHRWKMMEMTSLTECVGKAADRQGTVKEISDLVMGGQVHKTSFLCFNCVAERDDITPVEALRAVKKPRNASQLERTANYSFARSQCHCKNIRN